MKSRISDHLWFTGDALATAGRRLSSGVVNGGIGKHVEYIGLGASASDGVGRRDREVTGSGLLRRTR